MLIFSDVVQIEKTGEYFRLIYDVKGRFTIHRISAEEAKVNKLFFFFYFPNKKIFLVLQFERKNDQQKMIFFSFYHSANKV